MVLQRQRNIASVVLKHIIFASIILILDETGRTEFKEELLKWHEKFQEERDKVFASEKGRFNIMVKLQEHLTSFVSQFPSYSLIRTTLIFE